MKAFFIFLTTATLYAEKVPISQFNYIDLSKTPKPNTTDVFECNFYEPFELFEEGKRIFSYAEIAKMREKFWLLGPDKWKEAIDGILHIYGRDVFDCRLHGGNIEPGFMKSWEEANGFLSLHLGEKLTIELFLATHKILTHHFSRDIGTLHGAERSGKFRKKEDQLFWTIVPRGFYYNRTENLEALLNELDPIPALLSCPEENGAKILYYIQFSRKKIKQLAENILATFYAEIEISFTDDEKLYAIAKFRQHMGWLHPVFDGSGRLNTLIMNFLLTQYGFHPVILNLPYLFDVSPLDECVKVLKEGLAQWNNSL